MQDDAKHKRLWSLLFLALIAAIVVGGGVLVFQRFDREQPAEIDLQVRPATEVEVYLSGAVGEEGIYSIDEDTTIGDLLRSAGGVTDGGDTSRIKIRVLGQDENPYAAPGQEVAKTKININTATLEELETLPGIGETKAQAIIDHRNENGPFRSIEDLTKVKGIGSKTLEKMRDQITVVD